jgi:hypothetical protein
MRADIVAGAIQQLNSFGGQRQEAKFVALAAHAELGFGK